MLAGTARIICYPDCLCRDGQWLLNSLILQWIQEENTTTLGSEAEEAEPHWVAEFKPLCFCVGNNVLHSLHQPQDSFETGPVRSFWTHVAEQITKRWHGILTWISQHCPYCKGSKSPKHSTSISTRCQKRSTRQSNERDNGATSMVEDLPATRSKGEHHSSLLWDHQNTAETDENIPRHKQRHPTFTEQRRLWSSDISSSSTFCQKSIRDLSVWSRVWEMACVCVCVSLRCSCVLNQQSCISKTVSE